MSNVAKTNNSHRMLMVMLLGFSILNISSFMSQSLSERNLASEDDGANVVEGIGDCGLRKRLNGKSGSMKGNSLEVNCDGKYESNNKEVTGSVTVRKIKLSEEDQDFEFEVEMNLETECDTCLSNVRSTGIIRPTTKDLNSLERFISAQFKKESVKLLDAVKKDKKKQKDIAECRRAEDGELFSTDEQQECVVGKISNGDLEDKEVAKLYDTRLKPALSAMMQSGDPAQMQKAMAILSELRGAGTNGYVNSSVQDMMQFGGMRLKALQLEKQMALMDPSDPRYKMLSQQAGMLAKQSDRYFSGRIDQVQTQSMFMTDGFEYASSLIADLQTWQSDLSTSMGSLVQQAGNSVNGNGSAPVDVNNRTSRGGVAGPNGGGPNGGGPNGGNVGPNGGGSGIPQVGAPVNGNNGPNQNGFPQIPRQNGPQQNGPQQQQPPWMNQGNQQQQQPPWMQGQQPPQQQPPWMQQGPNQPPQPSYSNQPRPGQYGPGGMFPPLGAPGGYQQVPGFQGQMPPGYSGVPYRYM